MLVRNFLRILTVLSLLTIIAMFLVSRIDSNNDKSIVNDYPYKWSTDTDTDPLPVRFEDPLNSDIQLLREREELDQITKKPIDTFEFAFDLMAWVSRQWKHSVPSPDISWNATVFLPEIRAGNEGGYCAQFSQLLLQSFASYGIPARYIEIGSRENPYAHYIMEAWMSEYKKWVVFDADYSLVFTDKTGIPLNALEIRDRYLQQDRDDLHVLSTGVPVLADYRGWTWNTAELYFYVRVHLNSAQVTDPLSHPFDREEMVGWLDENHPGVHNPSSLVVPLMSTNRSEFYPDLIH